MTRADKRKYHYIYKITRLDESGKFYIGLHSTDNLEDSYFGSGKQISRSIKKHGKDKHQKEILEFLPTREALKLREKEIVNEELLKDTRCMNLCLGGGHGWDYVHKTFHDTTSNFYKYKMSGKLLANAKAASAVAASATSQLEYSTRAKKRWNDHRDTMIEGIKKVSEFAKSDKAKEKKKETFRKNEHQQGSKNSQYGTCWVYNSQICKKVKLEDVNKFLQNGFFKGRKNLRLTSRLPLPQ